MNATDTPRLIVPAIGAACAGGFCLGHVFVDALPYAIIVAPKAEGRQDVIAWNKSLKRVDGALSYFDGLANTRAMAAAGSELAKWAQGLRLGGVNDWHTPSRQDLLVVRGNVAAAGPLFGDNGAEAFESKWYWSSTQNEFNDDYAWIQLFGYGDQDSLRKSTEYRAFVVRREPIR